MDQPIDWAALRLEVENLIQRGRIDEAVGVLKGNIQAAHARGKSGAVLAAALNDLGTAYHDCGRFAEADRAYQKSLSHWARVPAPKPGMGIVLGNLAGLRFAQGKLSDAEKLFGEAKNLLIAVYGPESQEVAFVLCGLADVYWETRRFQDARLAAESALATSEKLRLDLQTGNALFVLAKIAWEQNRQDDAERLLQQGTEAWRMSPGPQHPFYASALSGLAVVLSKKDPGQATRLFRESLAILEAHLGQNHMFTGTTLLIYSKHLKTLGHKKEGMAMERRGKTILDEHARKNLLRHTFDIKAFQK